MTTEERELLTAVRDDLLRRAESWEEKPGSNLHKGLAIAFRYSASEITHYLEATE